MVSEIIYDIRTNKIQLDNVSCVTLKFRLWEQLGDSMWQSLWYFYEKKCTLANKSKTDGIVGFLSLVAVLVLIFDCYAQWKLGRTYRKKSTVYS